MCVCIYIYIWLLLLNLDYWLLEQSTTNKVAWKKRNALSYFAGKGPYSQSYDFSSSHVGMWELDYKEGWTLKNWCFWTVVMEKTLERPLGCREIKPVNPKGNQSWIFFGRTYAVAEAPTSATWCTEQTLRKRSWCWERLRAGKERSDRGWDGWMASLTQWTWV